TLIAVGAITALGTLGVNVAAMVAGLGLTGFALGFALKDMLSNLLAGVLILAYRPFRRGDRIAVAGFEGTVIGIDLRYTILQGEQRQFLIPNSVLLTNSISLHRLQVPKADTTTAASLHADAPPDRPE
ncbi:MAG: mechanosensitive ion channel domain-containing protein, partial [Gammaproteobacteria bacterium]